MYLLSALACVYWNPADWCPLFSLLHLVSIAVSCPPWVTQTCLRRVVARFRWNACHRLALLVRVLRWNAEPSGSQKTGKIQMAKGTQSIRHSDAFRAHVQDRLSEWTSYWQVLTLHWTQKSLSLPYPLYPIITNPYWMTSELKRPMFVLCVPLLWSGTHTEKRIPWKRLTKPKLFNPKFEPELRHVPREVCMAL